MKTAPSFDAQRNGSDSLSLPAVRTVRFATTQGTAMNVDVSPDGKTIVFDLLGDIYTVPIIGGTATRLTHGMAFDTQPVFSPDGTRIAFISDRSGNDNVWIMEADGGHLHPFTRESVAALAGPEWVPTGTAQVMAHQSAGYWLYDSVGNRTALKLLDDIGAVWSRDGRGVYTTEADRFNRGTLARFEPATGRLLAVSNGPIPLFRPAVSPDGQWVVVGARLDGKTGLRLIDVQTEAERWLVYPLTDRDQHVRERQPSDRRPAVAAMPRFAFTPDSRSVILADGGTFQRVDIRTGRMRTIPFRATVDQALGALVTPAAADTQKNRLGWTALPPMTHPLPPTGPTGTLVLRGATVLTMDGHATVRDATVVVTGHRITALGPRSAIAVPPDARVLDVPGTTILPGFIDLHGQVSVPHEEPGGSIPLAMDLAFGVTTVRDFGAAAGASPSTEPVAPDRWPGARLLPGGSVLDEKTVATLTNLDSIRAWVRRQQQSGTTAIQEGGLTQRRHRQWLAIAAREAGLALVGTTGGELRRALTVVSDGYPLLEGAIPAAPLYADVLQLLSASHTYYAPTLVATDGEGAAAAYFREREVPRHDPKLVRFQPETPEDLTWWAWEEYAFIPAGQQARRLHDRSMPIAVATAGAAPGLAVHWELWALQLTGMTPYDALRAATVTAAEGLGLGAELGTLAPGKVADLLVLDGDPLADLHNTRRLRYVMRNGELFDAPTLAMVWPRTTPAPVFRDMRYDAPVVTDNTGRSAPAAPAR